MTKMQTEKKKKMKPKDLKVKEEGVCESVFIHLIM